VTIEATLPARLEEALAALQAQDASRARLEEAMEALLPVLHRRLSGRESCQVALVGGSLWLDGLLVPGAFLGLRQDMRLRGIGAIEFGREVTAREVKELLALLSEDPERLKALGGPFVVFRARRTPNLRLAAAPPHADRNGPAPAASVAPDTGNPLRSAGSAADRSTHLRRELGRGLTSLGAESRISLLAEMLSGHYLELFFQAVAQILDTLAAAGPQATALALETLRDLAGGCAGEIPAPALAQMANGLLAALAQDRPGLDPALGLRVAAQLTGNLAVAGDPASLRGVMELLARSPVPAQRDLGARVLTEPTLAAPLVHHYNAVGRAALEATVLPFLHALEDGGTHALVAHLGEEPSRPHRTRTLELLRIQGRRSLPALRAALGSGSWHLLRNVLLLLGELEDHDSFDAIGAFLEHPEVRVRRAAVRASWQTGGAWAELGLLDLLGRADPETAVEILRGLGQIGSAKAIPAVAVLAASAPLCLDALRALGEAGLPEAIPILAGHLAKGRWPWRRAAPPEARLAAARALAAIGTPEAQAILGRTLRREPAGPVREALEALAGAASR
jgi:HEAT repeat protein